MRVRFLVVPLERDEGEYAYAGQLILQGVPPYTDVFNMKLPGIYAAYALILAVFGQSHVGVHLGLLVVNLTTIVLVYLLARRVIGTSAVGQCASLAAAGTFGLLALTPAVQGVNANSEHFVILPMVAGALALAKAIDTRRLVCFAIAGLLLGTAFIVKQHAVVWLPWAALVTVACAWFEPDRKLGRIAARVGLLAIASVVPFVIVCIAFAAIGAFKPFWFWTFTYARLYVGMQSLGDGLPWLGYQLKLLAIAGLPTFVFAGIAMFGPIRSAECRRQAIFIVSFLVFSFLAVCPGFYFREHYFVLLLPGLALAAGVGVSLVTSVLRRGAIVAGVSAAIMLGFTLISQSRFLFVMTPLEVTRTMHWPNPFPESLDVAAYIHQHSSPDDRVLVLGSEPQIYFYSHRRASTGFIYMYTLMETHPYAAEMQRKLIADAEKSPPKFIVYVPIHNSWFTRKDSNQDVLDWFARYVPPRYELVGMIGMHAPDHVTIDWDEAARRAVPPQNQQWVGVFRRKD